MVLDRFQDNAWATAVAKKIDLVFSENPSLQDHRKVFPWVTGFLGNPKSAIIFLGENPSLPTMKRASASPDMKSPEMQWNVSKGDKIFREALIKAHLKEGTLDSPGGWACYITNIVKMAVKPKEWNEKSKDDRVAICKMFAPVLQEEIDAIKPKMIAVMGERTEALFNSTLDFGALNIPEGTRVRRIWHYAFFNRGGLTGDNRETYFGTIAAVAAEYRQLGND